MDTKPAVTSMYTVELPLPPKECSRNTTCHWGSRGRAVKQYRSDCALAYMAAKIPAMPAICLSLAFYNGGRRVGVDDGLYRPKDEANAIDSFKAAQDALADAGVVPGDSRKYVKQGPVTIYGTAKEHKGRCGVVLTIEPLEVGK